MKELKVYILPNDIITEYDNNFTDEKFMELAKKHGEVYSIASFQCCWNFGNPYYFNPEYSKIRIL